MIRIPTVIGMLDNDMGHIILDEMRNALPYLHHAFVVDHDGSMFEYPAIFYAIQLSMDLNRPVLYLHTKGAFNQVAPVNSTTLNMYTNMPKGATQMDWQRMVRKMWYYEYGKNLDTHLKNVNVNRAVVSCPYTGKCKLTWFNGFIMNSLAAKKLSETFKYTTNRFYYEQMFKRLDDVDVVGTRLSNIEPTENRALLYDDVWSFYK